MPSTCWHRWKPEQSAGSSSTRVRESHEPPHWLWGARLILYKREHLGALQPPLLAMCDRCLVSGFFTLYGVCMSERRGWGVEWLNIFVHLGILMFDQMSLEYFLIRFPTFEMCQWVLTGCQPVFLNMLQKLLMVEVGWPLVLFRIYFIVVFVCAGMCMYM